MEIDTHKHHKNVLTFMRKVATRYDRNVPDTDAANVLCNPETSLEDIFQRDRLFISAKTFRKENQYERWIHKGIRNG